MQVDWVNEQLKPNIVQAIKKKLEPQSELLGDISYNENNKWVGLVALTTYGPLVTMEFSITCK